MSDGADNGRTRGATEALGVLQARPRSRRPPVGSYALALLARHVDAAAWNAAGLPGLSPQADLVPVSDEAVIRLAQLVMNVHCKDVPMVDRPALWSRLESFFARRLSASAPELVRLRELVCFQRLEAACMPPDVSPLKEILAFQCEVHGADSYLAGLTRANLSTAYQMSGDFALAAGLLEGEARVRARRYGRDHPVTLVTRSMFARALLLQAEAVRDVATRLRLARRALSLISEVRASRDRMYGPTAPNATRSRRYEGHALLLLGELDRARACLEHTLAFDAAREGQRDQYSVGKTHLLLARVYASQGNRDRALEHATRAQRILSAHSPEGIESGEAAAMLRHPQAGSMP